MSTNEDVQYRLSGKMTTNQKTNVKFLKRL